jgi:hypothetical protein
VTHSDEHKQNGTVKATTNQDFHSDSPPIASKTGKSVAAELNAKITAKQNSRLKQQTNGSAAKINKHMEPPKMKTSKTNLGSNLHHHEMQVQFIEKSAMLKNSYHNFHDVESRLSASKISINDFKAKATPPVALNLKRNYL